MRHWPTSCARTDRVGLLEELHRALDCFPGVMSARHVAGIKAGLAQRRSRLTPDVEAVDAERDDGFGLRQGADPIVETFGVAPYGSIHDVLRLRGVVLRARIDDLNRRPRLHHLPDFLDGDRRYVGKLLLLKWPRWRDLDGILVTLLYGGPIDVAHEGGDIGAGVRAEF